MESPKLEAPWCVISGSCTVSSRIGSVGAMGVLSPTGMNQGSRRPQLFFTSHKLASGDPAETGSAVDVRSGLCDILGY